MFNNTTLILKPEFIGVLESFVNYRVSRGCNQIQLIDQLNMQLCHDDNTIVVSFILSHLSSDAFNVLCSLVADKLKVKYNIYVVYDRSKGINELQNCGIIGNKIDECFLRYAENIIRFTKLVDATYDI